MTAICNLAQGAYQSTYDKIFTPTANFVHRAKDEVKTRILDTRRNVYHYIVFPAASLVASTDGLQNVLRAGKSIMEIAVRIFAAAWRPAVDRTIGVFGTVIECLGARAFIMKIDKILTDDPNKSIWKKSGWKISATVVQLFGDLCTTLAWLNAIKWIKLDAITLNIGVTRFFGLAGTFAIKNLKDAFGFIGSVLSIADAIQAVVDCRNKIKNGKEADMNAAYTKAALTIAGSIAKCILVLSTTALKAYAWGTFCISGLALVAAGTSIATFLMDEYKKRASELNRSATPPPVPATA